MTYREGLLSQSGKGSLFQHPFFKTAIGWKQQQRHGTLALVQRPEELGPLPLLLLQLLLIGSPLLPQIKAQEKIK